MRTYTAILVASLLLVATGAVAQQQVDPKKVDIKVTKLAEGVYELEGAGGNIGVSVGEDGVVLIDDQFAPLTPKIKAAVAKLSKKPIRFVINTHWHMDHVGGNENLGKAGAVIVAQDNVRKRMSVESFIEKFQVKVPAAPHVALPIITFADEVTFHLNGDDLHVLKAGPAHTDGDAIVHFTKANVVHMGDTLMTISYPFVDYSSGGSYDGFIAIADKVLAMTDANTKIIAGHGPPTDQAGLKAWRDMLVAIRARVAKAAGAGQTLEQIKAAKLTAEWDAKWGQTFIKADDVVEEAYRGLKGGAAPAGPVKKHH